MTDPVPVAIVAPDPIPVVLSPDSRKSSGEHVQRQSIDPSIPARTTFQEDLTFAGQRAINLIWETTQMRIALSVIWGALAVSASLAVFGRWLGTPDMQLAAIVFLFGVANLVTGFYFGRTNHSRTGGLGATPAGSEGR